MKLFTLAASFLLLFMFASCEKSFEDNLISEKLETFERSFFFTPEIKEGQELTKGYTISANLGEVTNESVFEAKWGNGQDFYAFEYSPAESQARLMKFFNGKECVELADFEMIERSNSLSFLAVEDEKGNITFSLDGKDLFKNVAESFRPSSGKYVAKGGLKVRDFQLVE